MLTNAQRATLLAAVPSFAPRWTAWQQDQLEYTSRFPEEKLSDEDEQPEFLRELASHVAERFTAAEAEGEIAALFAALEEIYAEADAQLYSLLTLFLLEELISDFERKGQDAAQLQKYVHGPLTTRAWRAAWDWMHPPAAPSEEVL
jgi:flagellar biosynthesis/type III secretory pathway protein FliH